MQYVDIPWETIPAGLARKPFSDAVFAGDTLYVSGRIGLDPQTGKPPSELADEARALMENLASVLASAGMTLDNLAMVTVFAPDVSHVAGFTEVYLSYFGDRPLPARAFVGSGPLLFGARFELTAIAVRTPSGG